MILFSVCRRHSRSAGKPGSSWAGAGLSAAVSQGGPESEVAGGVTVLWGLTGSREEWKEGGMRGRFWRWNWRGCIDAGWLRTKQKKAPKQVPGSAASLDRESERVRTSGCRERLGGAAAPAGHLERALSSRR